MPTAAQPARPIVLYTFTLSGHCHRVDLFLRLLGLPVQVVPVDLLTGEQRKPEFLQLNRFSQVPVIDDDGTVVADSNAILTYLALRYARTLATNPRRTIVITVSDFEEGYSVDSLIAEVRSLVETSVTWWLAPWEADSCSRASRSCQLSSMIIVITCTRPGPGAAAWK